MADLSDFISSSELLYWSTSACTASAIAGKGLCEGVRGVSVGGCEE